MGVGGFAAGAKLAMITTVPTSVTRFLAVAMPTALGMSLFIMGAFLFRLIDSGFPLPLSGKAS
jgi:hypothetical protein